MRLWTTRYIGGKLEIVESKYPRNAMKFLKSGALELSKPTKSIKIGMRNFNKYIVVRGHNERVMVFDEGYPIDMDLALRTFIEFTVDKIKRTINRLQKDIAILDNESTVLLQQFTSLKNESN